LLEKGWRRKLIGDENRKLVDLHLPEYENGKTMGVAYAKFETNEEAEQALEKLNNMVFDTKHTFQTCKYLDFDYVKNVPEEYETPDFTFHVTENLNYWLLEPHGCDQFVIRYDHETEVLWNGKTGSEPSTEVKRTNWTRRNFVKWSPLGTYLAILQDNVVELYGGSNWKKLKEFTHEMVDDVVFSPDERFIVTFSEALSHNDDEENPKAIVIWEVATEAKRRCFSCVYHENNQSEKVPVWPAFVWSFNSSYFSRLKAGYILIYESEDMSLLNKKPFKLNNPCTDHSWSPSDLSFAAYTPSPVSNPNVPARITIFSVPELQSITVKNFKNIINCTFLWHKKGDYLALKVDRVAVKGKLDINSSFDIFKIREKLIPHETLMLDEYVFSFSWEPEGKRFALVHSQDKNDVRPNVSIYGLTNQELKK